MKLPKDRLTEPELAVLRKHSGILGQLQGLAQARQETIQDIVGLALEARGHDPMTYEIRPDGTIGKKNAAEPA